MHAEGGHTDTLRLDRRAKAWRQFWQYLEAFRRLEVALRVGVEAPQLLTHHAHHGVAGNTSYPAPC